MSAIGECKHGYFQGGDPPLAECHKCVAEERDRLRRDLANMTRERDAWKRDFCCDKNEEEAQRLRVEVVNLKGDLEAAKAELHRWRHGKQVEGDYVCDDALLAAHYREALEDIAGTGDSEAWNPRARAADALEDADR